MERVILLVDDEENILAALTRLLRPEGYRILRAGSGKEGLGLLEWNEIGVIISDQRMPEMTGAEFLNQVKERWPQTMRIMLSGYTELASVTEAINRGAIYKFLTKPWDDAQLRAAIDEAFRYYEMESENRRLSEAVLQANAELTILNQELERRVEEKTAQVLRNVHVLKVSQEIVDTLPIGIIGVDGQGMVVVANRAASESLPGVALLGEMVEDCLPEAARLTDAAWRPVNLSPGLAAEVSCYAIGSAADAGGRVFLIRPQERQ